MTKKATLPNLLLLIAFFTDLFTPFLIWKGLIPASLRWVSHGAVAFMILIVVFRMIAFNRIPVVFWIILIISVTGFLVAILNGQGITATVWGWWLMFQYPMVCLFAYLQPEWPRNYAKWLLMSCIAVLALEVVWQLGQYFTGTLPGDQLAGTFGKNGTGNLILFIIFTLCLSLGYWLTNHNWIQLVLVFVLGVISSVLGEMKFFLAVAFVLGGVTLIIYMVKGNHFWRIIPYAFLLVLALVGFIFIYDSVVPYAETHPLMSYFTDPKILLNYLGFSKQTTVGQSYYFDLGRNFAISYGWEQINKDPLTLLFGYGLGARSESQSLGIVGRGIEAGNLGITSGTSLLVIMQEMGLFGLLALLYFVVVIVVAMVKQIREHPESDANSMRYGILFFTVMWPVWLWYNAAWTLRVPMLLYWSALGFVLGEFAPIKSKVLRMTFKKVEAEPLKMEPFP